LPAPPPETAFAGLPPTPPPPSTPQPQEQPEEPGLVEANPDLATGIPTLPEIPQAGPVTDNLDEIALLPDNSDGGLLPS
jgi:hypothetical protein